MYKLNSFRLTPELQAAIDNANDPIPAAQYLRSCLAYRYGLTDEIPRTLEEDKQLLSHFPNENELLTIKEAAKILGRQEATLRNNWIPEGKLASLKMPDGTLRVYKDLRPATIQHI